MKHAIPAVSLVLTTVWAGCGDSVEPAAEESGGQMLTSGAEGGDGEATDDAPTGDGTGAGTTDAAFVPIPARGEVKIVKIEANPGVAILLEENGVPVGGASRNAYLPKGRDALLRVFLDVPDDWTERNIEARLELTGGGVEQTLSDVFTIAGDTSVNTLDSGPYFGIRAEHVVPGVKYRLSLWEAEPGQEDAPEPGMPPVSPIDGPAFLGVESAFSEMRVVLVPVDYSFGGCSRVVDGEMHREAFADALYQQNAIESLDFQIHAPFVVDYDLGEFSGLSNLVGEMSQLRAQDEVDPNVYYYALFDNCGKCIGGGGGLMSGCTVGLAFDITGGGKSDAYARAAAGQLNAGADDTFVHEIGHTQGRRHIECAGAGTQAAGTDPSYPYEGGVIGKWGFGVRDFRLRHPMTNADYMSYCGQTWASDWQWNATYMRIKELSSWSMAGAPAAGGAGQLVGTIEPDGTEKWWTVPGEFAADRAGATHGLTFDFADGSVASPASVRVRPDSETLIVVTGLPADFDRRALTGLRVRDEHGERPIALDGVRFLHAAGDLAAGSPR